jgi:hypothetical protein
MYNCFSRVAWYTLDDSDDETQSRAAVGRVDRGSASLRNISASNMGGIQSIGGLLNLQRAQDTSQSTIHSNHVHVAGTGNDQAIATPGERMPRMPPYLHITRQTATAAVSGRCHCWFVYIHKI